MLLEEGYRARFQVMSLKLVEEAYIESLRCMEMENDKNCLIFQFLRRRNDFFGGCDETVETISR